MASVFVSHSSRDRTVTERVVKRLRAAGFAALFVDFDPEQGIPAGRNGEWELCAQLRRSDAVVFLANDAWVASRCFTELNLAHPLGRPVFPLRLQAGVTLPLLGYTLHGLHQQAGPDRRITAADYDAVGGVVGALRHRADRLTDEPRRRGLGSVVLRPLMRLASVTGDEPPTRRRVTRDAFSPEERVVIDAFVDATLLASSHNPANPARGGSRTPSELGRNGCSRVQSASKNIHGHANKTVASIPRRASGVTGQSQRWNNDKSGRRAPFWTHRGLGPRPPGRTRIKACPCLRRDSRSHAEGNGSTTGRSEIAGNLPPTLLGDSHAHIEAATPRRSCMCRRDLAH
jgi:hypothetical protein